MGTLPSARTRVVANAAAAAKGVDSICIIACCPLNDDITPRDFGSAAAIEALHGYCAGVDYAAFHGPATNKPMTFIGLPIDTPGVVEDEDDAGNTGTSVVSLVVGADGVLDEHEGIIKVLVGGTVGTDQIKLSVSMDKGRTYVTKRLGTALTMALSPFGLSFAATAGTLIAGETILTWKGTAPLPATADYNAARVKLAERQTGHRTWFHPGDFPDAAAANAMKTQVYLYETANERFTAVRGSVPDRDPADTKAEWMATVDASFASVDAAFRVVLSAGRARMKSLHHGWDLRRPLSWDFSIREYQHDLHIAPFRKDDGAIIGDIYDSEQNLAEWDDRVDGKAGTAARFVVARSWANGPGGAFIALGCTREVEGSLLSESQNVAVTNLVCTVVQLNTEAVIGRTLLLNEDGTATKESLAAIAGPINAALELQFLTNKGEGQRASYCVWTPDADTLFNVPEPLLTGVTKLILNGTVHSVDTQVQVIAGGQ